MRIPTDWADFEVIDTDGGERLERWGDILLIRPDPQVIWNTGREDPRWGQAHARYVRSREGGGHWEKRLPTPDAWNVRYGNLCFQVRPMGFKHTGLFPEQAVNWNFAADLLRRAKAARPGRRLKILNLFAYTGGFTVAAADPAVEVTHVDASRGMVAWAKENARLSGRADCPIRWLTDDCVKFVDRELRRGNHYDGICMDPPSYGRGPGGEVWKLEDKIFPLITACEKLLGDDALFFIVNSYTTGLPPSVMEYMLSAALLRRHGGRVTGDEIGLPVTTTGFTLPCGSTALWTSEET